MNKISDELVYQGRLDFSLLDFANDDNVYGAAHTEGLAWEEMRQFVLEHLPQLGKSYGRFTPEEIIMRDVNEFIENMRNNDGTSIGDVKKRYWTSIGNSLWAMLTGKMWNGHNNANLRELTNKSMG